MKENNENDIPHPRSRASLFSVLFFTYTLDTFRRGKFWKVSNLYKPLDCHRSEILGEKLWSSWMYHNEECRKSGRKPSLLVVLFRVFWFDILTDCSLLILSLVPRIIQPLLLGNILCYFSPKSTISKSEAYWYIALLVIFNLMSTIVSIQYKFSSSITALKIKVSCSTCVHKKVLKMNGAAQNNAINIISNDLSRFDRTSNYVHYVWGSPLFLISILNLLYYDVGLSGLVGVLWFILYMILQSFFARWIGSYRNKIAKKTDIRIKLMNEILSSMKVLKMYSWEKPFCRLVENSRNVEMSIVKKVTYFKGILYSLQAFINISAVFLALLSMVILNEEINAPKVFKLIMYYYSFNYVITLMFPLSVTKATELQQVLKRVNEFLLQKDIEEPQENLESKGKYRVVLEDFTSMWYERRKPTESSKPFFLSDEDSLLKNQVENYVLHKIDTRFETGMLYGVTGPVGSGKSTLLLSILGETISSGSLQVNGSVSYASQDPWFFNGTIKQNILFDEPLEEERYSEVIRVCGLKADLDELPAHDLTLVGDGGSNLSGGQKSRINLARAIYRKVDIYLFDDPLSSVDGGVANSIMEECMLRFLKDKCRILVTHNVNHLQKCDRILILNSGRIEKEGSFNELEKEGCISLGQLLQNTPADEVSKLEKSTTIKTIGNVPEKKKPFTHQKGKKSDLLAYLTSGNNICVVFLVLFIFILTQTSESLIFLFISYWTHIEETKVMPRNVTLGHRLFVVSGRYLHLFLFTTILGILLVSSVFRAVSYAMMVMRSSKTLHNKMLYKVVNSKMDFFERVDIGQILSRFSKDLGAVDEILPRTILESCIVVLGIIARILLIGYVNPYLIIVVLLFVAAFSHFIKVFVYTSKNIKRIEGNLMGPVITQVRSTIQGLSTIRAAKAQEVVEREYSRYQNRYTSSCYMFDTITHAFGFAVEFITTIFISIVTVSCFFMEDKIQLNGSSIGLAITQSMAFTTYLQFCIIQCVQANNHLVAVERIQEYDDLPQEIDEGTAEGIAQDWPHFGSICFRNVQVRYGDAQPVLRDLNFDIRAGEKIGIVGRTGGGKSSLIASILKLADVSGEILIDSNNIQHIPAHLIRSRISVIPQDPVIFSGTLRYNLDPLAQFDDHVLYQSLQKVDWPSISSDINDLDYQIAEGAGGSNLSIGQKQLICLARIIIRRSRIVLIDEATSNMDIETDEMMQKVLRKQFKDCTVLTIAHRVTTVLDYDKIMVIDSGRLIEFDSPEVLLKDERSKLYDMMRAKNK